MTVKSERAITTRPARVDDLDSVVALLDEGELPLDGLGSALLWVAEVPLQPFPVGVVGLEVHGSVGLVRSLAVRKQERGAGVGRRLLDCALERALDLGLSAVYCLTLSAAPLFAAAGFSEVPRGREPTALRNSTQFSGACPDSARLLCLRLGG